MANYKKNESQKKEQNHKKRGTGLICQKKLRFLSYKKSEFLMFFLMPKWYVLHCKQPYMYHSIVLPEASASAYFGTHGYKPFEDFIKEALNRSCGQTMEFCQKLKYFRLHTDLGPMFKAPESNFDEDAFHIAKHMPQLHHLHLEFSKLTNKGLQAILQGCPSLEYIALQQCSNIALQKNMLKIGAFSKIRNVRVWNESQHHFEFDLCTNDEM